MNSLTLPEMMENNKLKTNYLIDWIFLYIIQDSEAVQTLWWKSIYTNYKQWYLHHRQMLAVSFHWRRNSFGMQRIKMLFKKTLQVSVRLPVFVFSLLQYSVFVRLLWWDYNEHINVLLFWSCCKRWVLLLK